MLISKSFGCLKRGGTDKNNSVCIYIYLHIKSKKLKQVSGYNKTETEFQIQRTSWWLPLGRGKWGGGNKIAIGN